MFWSKGTVNISGGTFTENYSRENGGVFFASNPSKFIVNGGVFANNTSKDGGVAVVGDEANLLVESGAFSWNEAESQGGAFSVEEGGGIQVLIERWNNDNFVDASTYSVRWDLVACAAFLSSLDVACTIFSFITGRSLLPSIDFPRVATCG